MKVISKVASDSVNRYFDILTKVGYKNYTDVGNLLILTFLEEILSSNYNEYITEEDYNTIVSAIYTLSGNSCMIDFPNYATYDSIIKESSRGFSIKINEDSNIIGTEDDYIKSKM